MLCGGDQVSADAVDVQIDDGLLAVGGEKELVFSMRIHEEVLHKDCRRKRVDPA